MTVKSRRLLPRQLLFAEYCLTEPTAARAAVRAGYSPRSARNQAYRLLANDDIRRQIVGGLAARQAEDARRRAHFIDQLARLFDAAIEAGRPDAALTALKTECEVSGLILRQRPTPAQRADEADLLAEASAAIGPCGAGKL